MKEGGNLQYCNRCVMPTSRPGLTLDSEGVCSACRHTEHKKTVDWKAREKEFIKLCDTHKSHSDENDCLVAVSAGKDSFWQVMTLKKYGMNPLLVSVDNLDWTQTGLQNFETMQSRFGVEALVLKSNKEINKKISRAIFEHDGFLAYLFDRYIYTYPIHMAIELNIPLIFYGENTSLEYGGPLKEETPSALNQINNDAVREYDWSIFEKAGVKKSDIPLSNFPNEELIHESQVDPQYLSYYFNWSGYEHMKASKMHGWKSLNDTGEWQRKGWANDDYTQIDDFAYLVDPWMKWPKYGHRQVTDLCSKLIREGRMTREDAIKLVREYDPMLDPTSLEHYLRFSGYSERQFFDIIDKFYNRSLFVRRDNKWILKNPIWKTE